MATNDLNNKNEEINIEKKIDEQVEEIEEQYRILKDEEEQEEKRKMLVLLVLFFLVFGISFAGATFSYITYKNAVNRKPSDVQEENKGNNNGNGNNPEDMISQSMQVLFTSGAEFIAEDITPGWESKSAKDFYVENTGTLDANYTVKFINIENNFKNSEDLRYTLECNGKKIIEDASVPTNDTVVLPEEVVKKGQKNTYQIYFKYVDTGLKQDEDAGKTYKMYIDVTNGE